MRHLSAKLGRSCQADEVLGIRAGEDDSMLTRHPSRDRGVVVIGALQHPAPVVDIELGRMPWVRTPQRGLGDVGTFEVRSPCDVQVWESLVHGP